VWLIDMSRWTNLKMQLFLIVRNRLGNKINDSAHEQLPRLPLNLSRFSDHESADFQRQHYQRIIKPVNRECNHLHYLPKFPIFTWTNAMYEFSSWSKLNLTNLERKLMIELWSEILAECRFQIPLVQLNRCLAPTPYFCHWAKIEHN
jgi:hypothetical protein